MRAPDPREQPTLSIEQAARLIGISRGAAYEAARTGELPVLRIGRRLLVPTARLLEWLGLSGSGTAADHRATGDARGAIHAEDDPRPGERVD